MKRYGPLLAVPGALAIGDPGRHHLRLTVDAVYLREGPRTVQQIAWHDVESIALEVPTTRFRLPGLASTILLGAVTFLAADMLDFDPDDGAVEVTAAGSTVRARLSRHHVGGYWRPTVSRTHRLLAHLVRVPDQRALLNQPEALVDLAAKLARNRPLNDG